MGHTITATIINFLGVASYFVRTRERKRGELRGGKLFSRFCFLGFLGQAGCVGFAPGGLGLWDFDRWADNRRERAAHDKCKRARQRERARARACSQCGRVRTVPIDAMISDWRCDRQCVRAGSEERSALRGLRVCNFRSR